MNTLSIKKQVDAYLIAQETGIKIHEVGKLRRTKMHASYLMETLDNKSELTPALRELLEASLTLQTTSTKILAAYLHRSPTTIRAEFQRICTILSSRVRHSASRTTKNKDFLNSQFKTDKKELIY